jgi:hypothetical protein
VYSLVTGEIGLKKDECAQFNFRHRFWPKFDPPLVFCGPIWAKFTQFGKFSATFGVDSARIDGGN